MVFDKALKFTLQWEGGYVNDPNDPGGETKYGISKRAHPELDIKNLTMAEAGRVYVVEYWNPLGCSGYPDALACSIFDAGVNCGVSRVKGWINGLPNMTADSFNDRREYYYTVEIKKSLRDRYLKGWLNRLNSLRRFVESMQKGDNLPLFVTDPHHPD